MNYQETIYQGYSFFNDMNVSTNGSGTYHDFGYQGYNISNSVVATVSTSTSNNYSEYLTDGYIYSNTSKSYIEARIVENYSYSNVSTDKSIKSEKINDLFTYSNDSLVGKLISLTFDDTFNYSNQVSTNAEYLSVISENYSVKTMLNTYKEVNGVLEIDDSLDCWVVNTENNAFSRYSNFYFNSFAKLGNNYYGVNELGLFKIEGTTDNEKEIKAKVLTGRIDVSGIGSLSYVRDIFIYHKSDGTLRLRVYANDGKVESYRMINASDDIISSKINLSKGRKAIYWQFELTNDEQTDFEIEKFKVYKVITGSVT